MLWRYGVCLSEWRSINKHTKGGGYRIHSTFNLSELWGEHRNNRLTVHWIWALGCKNKTSFANLSYGKQQVACKSKWKRAPKNTWVERQLQFAVEAHAGLPTGCLFLRGPIRHWHFSLFAYLQFITGGLSNWDSAASNGWLTALPLTGRQGTYSSETSRLPYILDNRLTDGREVVSLMCRPPFTTGGVLILISVRCWVTLGPWWDWND
jgi:hypothetical protein